MGVFFFMPSGKLGYVIGERARETIHKAVTAISTRVWQGVITRWQVSQSGEEREQ